MRLTPPETQDTHVFDITLNLFTYPAVLIAHKLGLFETLNQPGEWSVTSLSSHLGLAPRAMNTLLNVSTAFGFIHRHASSYALSATGKEYLVKTSPYYFGDFWNLMIDNAHLFAFEHLEKAVVTNTPQFQKDVLDIFDANQKNQQQGIKFTHAMHSLSMAQSCFWPRCIDLQADTLLLDIGGGSGAHAIGALAQWPHLRAVVFDYAAICKVCEHYVSEHQLTERITTHSGDMWHDPFPPADVHFYSNVLHDWPPEKAAFLIGKSFDALPNNGRILLHEVLYNDAKDNLAAIAYSLMMLSATQGQQFSAQELEQLLIDAGFVCIKTLKTNGHMSIVSAYKPG